MERLRLLVPLSHIWPGYAPIALVRALGYDHEEGIEVDNIPVGSPTHALRGVVDGDGDMTFINTAFGFVARDQKEPLRMFYAFARRTNRSFAVPADSPIRSIRDLKGGRIASQYKDLHYLAHAALRDEGIDPDRDVTFVDWCGPFDRTDRMAEALRTNQVQALWQLDITYGLFAAEGLALHKLPAYSLDRLTPSASIYAHDRATKERGAVLGAYGCALAKATLFAMTNPGAAVRLVWQHVEATRPHPDDEKKALLRDCAALKARLENSRPEDGPDKRWGAITLSEIANWEAFMLRTDAIHIRRPPTEYYTDALIERFNALDRKAVISIAKQFD
jgi:NitT/TauT family transport system substrate-binding protein